MNSSRETKRPAWWLRTASSPRVSRLVGRVYRTPLPRLLVRPVIRAYTSLLGVDLSEVALPLSEFRSLDSFFTRTLVPGARPIDPDPRAAVWPADGTLLEAGELGSGQDRRSFSIKGTVYALEALLGDPAGAQALEGGGFAVIHLSPRDYHRIHWPMDLTVLRVRHIPGRRYPVNRLGLESGAPVYIENERVVMETRCPGGEPFYIVLVAAFGVGGISLSFDTPPAEAADDPFPSEKRYPEGRKVRKGEDLGAFHLGSSVVMGWSRGAMMLKQPLPERSIVGRCMGQIQQGNVRG